MPRLRCTPLLAAVAVAAALAATGCERKPGDGPSGVNPPSGTRSPDQAPPSTPRQP